MDAVSIIVRTGYGTVRRDGTFDDEVGTVTRVPKPCAGYAVVRYKRRRYQLHGGIHTPHFICVNHPL